MSAKVCKIIIICLAVSVCVCILCTYFWLTDKKLYCIYKKDVRRFIVFKLHKALNIIHSPRSIY